MADTAQLEDALRKADATGNVADARAIAAEIRRVREADPAMAAQWSAASPMERAKMLVKGSANTVANLGIRGAAPAIGQAIGASAPGPTGRFAAPILGAAFGAGGEAIAQYREGTFPRWGAMLGAAGTGALPMSPLKGATAETMKRQAVQQGTANVVASAGAKAIDEQQLVDPREAFLSFSLGAMSPYAGQRFDKGTKVAEKAAERLRMSIPDENLVNGIQHGYVMTPQALSRAVNKPSVGAVNTALQSVGGLAPSAGHAILLNQRVTNELGAQTLGLPKNTPLRRAEPKMGIVGTAEEIRDKAAAPYRELASMSEQAREDLKTIDTKNNLTAQNEHERAILMDASAKKRADLALQAGADINDLKTARFKAKENFDLAMSKEGDPELLAKAREFWDEAKALETKIEKAAKSIGRPGLADEMRIARKQIAQSYVIDNALDHNGNVSAAVLGKMLDKGVPLTDELRVIAKFEQAAGGIMRDAAKAPSATADALRFATGLGTAAVGTGAGLGHGTTGAAAGAMAGMALPYFAQWAAKRAMFKPSYQQAMLTPDALLSSVNQPDLLAQFARFSTASAGREPNSFLKFLEDKYPLKQNPFLMGGQPAQPPQAPRPAPQVAQAVAAPAPIQEAPAVQAPVQPQFKEGQVYQDPQTGVRKRYSQGQWVDI